MAIKRGEIKINEVTTNTLVVNEMQGPPMNADVRCPDCGWRYAWGVDARRADGDVETRLWHTQWAVGCAMCGGMGPFEYEEEAS